MPNLNLIYYLAAGCIFGALALKTGIPAAPLAGALIGASILSISGKVDLAEWPIDAIHPDTEENMEKWAEINRIYSEKWPVITEKKDPPKDAKEWENIKNKFLEHFSEKPGE